MIFEQGQDIGVLTMEGERTVEMLLEAETIEGTPALSPPLAPGTTLGPYSVTAKIGEGGMGEVYKARDTRLDRTVAIKVLPEHVASDPDLKQRCQRIE